MSDDLVLIEDITHEPYDPKHDLGGSEEALRSTQLHCVSPGMLAIAKERMRQMRDLDYTPAHDDEHDAGELGKAAAFYALDPKSRSDFHYRQLNMSAPRDRKSALYPFNDGWFSIDKFLFGDIVLVGKGTHDGIIDRRIRELAAAGALAAAEIDRLLRLKAQPPKPQE